VSKKSKRKVSSKKAVKKTAKKAAKRLRKEEKAYLKALLKAERKAEKKARKAAKAKKAVAEVAAKSPPKISEEVKAAARQKRDKLGQAVIVDPFKPYKPMPGVVPKSKRGKLGFPIAMDEQIIEVSGWAAANVMNGIFQNGAAFIGYPVLSELAQIPEYRKIVECIATHMTRKFIKLNSTAKEDDKSDKIRQLNDALDAFRIRDLMRKACEVDGFFGRAHIYIDTGDGDKREELLTSIGNGRDAMSREKATGDLKSVRGFKVVEPIWTYPANYNASDPLTNDWYNPSTWFVQGKELHKTRIIPMVGREVPDMLKPAYSFGGLSMSQMAMPYINNWLRTRQSVADMIWSFSVSGIKTDLNAMLAPGARQGLFDRIDLFNDLRNNRGLMVMQQGGDTGEEFFQFNTPLGTLDMLQAQAQEQMASVSSIPLVFLLGISPHGLNASSEGEIRAFYDYIHSFQMKFFHAPLTTIIDFIQLKLWGAIDDDITFSFEPLWSLDEKGVAEVQKIRAETDDLLINGAIIAPAEARQRVAADPNSEYPDIDVDDLPEPPMENIGGASLNPGEAKPKDGTEADETDMAMAA
jgi:hypothetical protein